MKTIALPFLLCIGLAIHLSAADAEQGAGIWVAPDGSDINSGTHDAPLASLPEALRRAREWRRLNDPAVRTGIHIVLRGGEYPMAGPLLIRSEDSGTEKSPTIVEAAPAERPVLSGAVPITGWRRVTGRIPGLPPTARRQVWAAEPPALNGRTLELRQLWVNDRRAVRARQPNGEMLDRLLVWDRAKQEAWIPKASLGSLRNPAGVEMIFHQQWEIAICRLRTLDIEGSRARVTFQSPEGPIQFAHPWPQPVMSTNGNGPFYLANAIEFLDEPGEWFQESSNRIYYWPRKGEDLARAQVRAPVLETLVQIRGTLDQPVAHFKFRNIGFNHTAWLRPSHFGHVPLQAGMYLLDAYKLSPKGTAARPGLDNQAWIGRPPAAVSVRGAHDIQLERCRFEHLASAGLDFESGTHNDVVEGCLFRDIGGNGIQWGMFSDPGVETHRPYIPSDPREICARERIANNVVTDCANDDWGSVGICVGYGREIAIEHNDVSNVSYTGISVGWGWTKATNCMADNRIIANHVHHVATRMCDTAGIYTLSVQPGTLVAENSVHDIHMSPYVFNPQHWFYLYLDEGSSYITVRDNWCPAEKFLKNANGPGNEWSNNGPMVSQQIKDAAGLEPAYRDLLSEIEPTP